jgi:hypothetical protein
MWLRKTDLVPNMSSSLQTAEVHLVEGQVCFRSRHWMKQSLWYNEQKLEGQQFPKDKDDDGDDR